MSFWDIASKAGKFALDAGKVMTEEMSQKSDEMRKTQSEYLNKSDSELSRIVENDGFMGNSSTERSIAKKILRDRGAA